VPAQHAIYFLVTDAVLIVFAENDPATKRGVESGAAISKRENGSCTLCEVGRSLNFLTVLLIGGHGFNGRLGIMQGSALRDAIYKRAQFCSH